MSNGNYIHVAFCSQFYYARSYQRDYEDDYGEDSIGYPASEDVSVIYF